MSTVEARNILRTMTVSGYDLQQLRMQTGLRVCANFRSRLMPPAPTGDPLAEDYLAASEAEAEQEAAAVKVIDELKKSYKRLTDGVARNRRLPEAKGFKGDELITDFTELVLVDQYLSIEANERRQFAQLETALEALPIWNDYLKGQTGIGPAMAAVLVSYFDPAKAHHVSNFWAYAGLDVAPDGFGRSKRTEHLIDRAYVDKAGDNKTKKSVTYEPWLKSKLMGALAPSFMRTKNCPWRSVYDGYKNRLLSDPARFKCTSAEYKREYKANPAVARLLWPPKRIHQAALRYMVKQFLAEFWLTWRKLEGLPVTEPYHVAKLGMAPHSRVA